MTQIINERIYIDNTKYSAELVYILGLLWADGYVAKNGNSIGIECNWNDMQYFHQIFQKIGDYILVKRSNRNIGTIRFSSKVVAEFLKEHDFQIKSITTPIKILNIIPKSLQKYFYLGWSDGDGCFYYNHKHTLHQFTLAGSYNQNWGAMIDLCEKLNIKYHIKQWITDVGRSSSFRICKISDIVVFGNYLYCDHNFGMIRKKQIFDFIVKYYNERIALRKKVFCYDVNMKLINEFDQLKDASEWINKDRYVGGDINDCIRGRQKTAFGYKWSH